MRRVLVVILGLLVIWLGPAIPASATTLPPRWVDSMAHDGQHDRHVSCDGANERGAAPRRAIRSTSTDATLYLDGMEVTAEAVTTDGVTSIQKRGTRYYGSHAMRTATGTNATATLTTLLRNHQNSASTQITAGTVKRQRYTPFGARRGTERFTGTDRGFLDKTEDPTGLVQVGARFYDPSIARCNSRGRGEAALDVVAELSEGDAGWP